MLPCAKASLNRSNKEGSFLFSKCFAKCLQSLCFSPHLNHCESTESTRQAFVLSFGSYHVQTSKQAEIMIEMFKKCQKFDIGLSLFRWHTNLGTNKIGDVRTQCSGKNGFFFHSPGSTNHGIQHVASQERDYGTSGF